MIETLVRFQRYSLDDHEAFDPFVRSSGFGHCFPEALRWVNSNTKQIELALNV